MDKPVLPPEEFCKLTISMLVSHLINVCHQVEKSWEQTEKRSQLLMVLKSYLHSLKTHSSPTCTGLAKLSSKLKDEISYQEFINIVIPIERQFNNSVADHDILVETDDKNDSTFPKKEVFFILDNIRSAFNVGSIFRSAECFGIKKIYLCGYTSTPNTPKTVKTTMGTHKFIDWEHKESITSLIQELKESGYNIYAMETSPQAVSLKDLQTQFPCAFIFGNEKFGLDLKLISQVDKIVQIPLLGRKNSLNVGVTAGIVGSFLP